MPDMTTLILDGAATPLLHRDAATRLAGDRLIVETPFWEITVDDHAQPLSALLDRADGTIKLDALAEAVGLAPDLAARLLEPLAEEGAVIDASAPIRVGDAAFLDVFQQECRLMMRALAEQPFWRRILSGQASPTLVFGWGLEFAHFVDSANEYMPIGIAHARESAEIREIFARHYVEEANHAAIFFDGLARCGLDRARMAAAPPLATTRALINLLVEHALEGSVAYAAGFAVMQPETEPTERGNVVSFYADLSALYPFAAPMFRAFERHACLDLDLGHHETVFKSLWNAGGVPLSARPQALRAARSVAEAFTLFFEGILGVYGTAGAEFPRRPARM
ncbi:hypothetical protein AB5I39_00050 [Sphingomonas sp. MMS24-J45]|uniref:hypothetical protein n=1 Tax=Sphingomonas sp. MMS24-J45 TaxID=3238806 RepID=UPI00384FD59A